MLRLVGCSPGHRIVPLGTFPRVYPRFCSTPSFQPLTSNLNPELDKAEQKRLYARQHYIQNREARLSKAKQYREQNKETINSQRTQNRLENREAINAKAKQIRLKNRDTINERARQRRLQNRDSINEKVRQYSLKNRETINARARERRPPSSVKSWKTPKDVRGHMDQLAEKLNIQHPTDWYRVSAAQLVEQGYGRIVTLFNGLGPALTFAYPEVEWDLAMFSARNKRSVQRWLLLKLAELLPPGTRIDEEYSHPKIKEKAGYVLDMFVPKYNLALEYQGVQHYSPQKGCFGSLDQIQKNDTHKRQLCEEAGITLVAIPYWWNKTKETLAATLNLALPNVIGVHHNWKPIPNDPPKPHPVEIWGQEKTDGIGKIMMHGRHWNAQQTDPTGWIITEKYDGVRGYWDGQALYTKNGYLLNAPKELVQLLPPNIPLDGEFWLGEDKFYELVAIINRAQIQKEPNEDETKKLWEPVMYRIFDAPGYDGSYVERIAWAKSCLSSGASPRVSVAPFQVCEGLDHLSKELDKVKAKGGEGLMIYHPTEKYSPGRTKIVQKVKSSLDTSQVSFQRLNAKSVALICQQANGVTCLVKCPPYDFHNPPAQGTMITVQHAGYHTKSKKMKSPVLVKIQ